jgi:hypothetical protein
MNPLAQPDIHPDADSLNAFVERVLPEAERTRIVAHMAECSRCREVIYLAHAAAGDEAEAALPASAVAPSRRGWWSPTWRIAWIPAAALAAVGGVLIWIQSRPAPPSATVAQLSPNPPQLGKPPAVPAMDRPAPLSPQVAAKRAQPGKSNGALAGRKREARSKSSEELLSQSSRKSSLGASSAGNNAISLVRQAPQPEALPTEPATAPFQPALADAKLQPPHPTEKSQILTSRAMAGAPAPAPPNMLAVHGAVAAPAPGPAGPGPLAVQSLPQMQLKLSPQQLNNLMASRLARRPKLPSGLNAVSSASMQTRLIAVDSDGAVFLSQDAGKPWEPVPPRWAGKAIEVHVEPRTADEFGSATESISVTAENASPPVPAPADKPTDKSSTATAALGRSPVVLFKLETDRHQTWVSEDGKIWHRQ